MKLHFSILLATLLLSITLSRADHKADLPHMRRRWSTVSPEMRAATTGAPSQVDPPRPPICVRE